MAGIRIEPSAETSATAEPEISAKNIDAPIDTIASPPRMKPSIAEAKAISRREMPEAFMIAPARMNSGIAMQREVGRAVVEDDRQVRAAIATPCDVTIATTATMPSDTAIGTSMSTSASTSAKRSRISISATPPR